MIIETAIALSPATLATVLATATESKACAHFLKGIKAYAYQKAPAAGEKAWTSPRVLGGSFTFRVELVSNANNNRGEWHTLDEMKLRRAVAMVASSYPDVYGKIAAGKATRAESCLFFQFALFGYIRFDVVAPKAAPRKRKA